MRRNRVLFSALAALLIAACAVSAPKPKPKTAKAPPTASGYAGTKACLACHVKFAKTWSTIPHNKLLTAANRKPAESGCEACHGPGKTHATTDRSKIIRFKPGEVTAADGACLKCHAPKVTAANWKASSHAKIGLGCLTCHDPHYPKVQKTMLRNKELGNCEVCHGAVLQAASEGKHHKLPKGVNCTQCHTAHGSSHGKGLAKPKDQLCKTCHGEGAAKPESHKAADFTKTHGQTAKSDDSSCKGCHDKEKFCTKCHGFEMPHPQGWMMGHKDKGASLAADSKCFKCHERKKGCVCHGSG